MSYLKRIELDEEARRYLKHFEVFEGTRMRALSYLDQVWHALAFTLRKLSNQPHYADMKVELLGASATQGVKWIGLVQGERIYLELSDVRSWPSMSGVWVGCALGAESRSGRELIRQRVRDEAAHALLPKALQDISAPLSFGIESDRQLCLPLPLSARPPTEEAQTLLGYGLSLWGLLNGDSVFQSQSPAIEAQTLLPSNSAETDDSDHEEDLHEETDPYDYGFYQEEDDDERPNSQKNEKPRQENTLSVRAQRLAEDLADDVEDLSTHAQVPHQEEVYPSEPHHSEPHHSEPHHSEPYHSEPYHSEPHHSESYHSESYHSEPHHSEPLIQQQESLLTEKNSNELDTLRRSRLGHVTPLETPLQLDDDDDLYPQALDPIKEEPRPRPPLRPRPSSRRGRNRASVPPRMPEAEFEQLSADELEEQLRHFSKDEMISLIAEQRRMQQNIRSTPPSVSQPRVIGGGGRRDLSAVTGEAERFIPKRLEEPPPPRPSVKPQPATPPSRLTQAETIASPFDHPPPPNLSVESSKNTVSTQGEESELNQLIKQSIGQAVSHPIHEAHHPSHKTTESTLDSESTLNPHQAHFTLAVDDVKRREERSPEHEFIEPHASTSSIAPSMIQGAQVQLFSEEDPVTPPSYIKSMQQENHELDIFTQALTRCGLPPWRINSYADGQGKIIWLSNGAHIDIAPDGEVTLGGESQEDTRTRLARVGVTLL